MINNANKVRGVPPIICQCVIHIVKKLTYRDLLLSRLRFIKEKKNQLLKKKEEKHHSVPLR